MSTDMKTEITTSSEGKVARLKTALSHIGLLVALMVYTVFGGMIFRELEAPAELSKLEGFHAILTEERVLFLKLISNSSDIWTLSEQLATYEDIVQEAVRGGISLPLDQFNVTNKWNFLQAVFFASTVITTIGYGNIAPVTFGGQMFCIFYAMVGIPLTLTVIADLGRIFATAVSALMGKIRKHMPDIGCINNINEAARRSIFALAAILFLFVYLAAGARIFMIWEENWEFFHGFYFCFVTMTTIGFGDIVPQRPKYMLLCTLYILLGLALTSTIIELVCRQYAQSWRRIQQLSGPMADALRRLGEGRGNIDVTALQRMLTVISVPRKQQGGVSSGKQQKEWEEAMAALLNEFKEPNDQARSQKVFQIVIYESSV